MADVRVVRFLPSDLITCDELLLADYMLKSYCDFICDKGLEENDPIIKPDIMEDDISDEKPSSNDDLHSLLVAEDSDNNDAQLYDGPDLNIRKQLVLARSCLADVLYSIYCLGSWCAKRTIKLYIVEFSRILHSTKSYGQQASNDILGSTLTMLQCFFVRLEELTTRLKSKYGEKHDDLLMHGSSHQLRVLLHYIKDCEPSPNSTWPVCIVHVHRKLIAKVIALWLREVSSELTEYAFIKPNYMVGSSRKHRNRMAVDNFDLHHEASVRDFRFGKCNTLIMSSMNERCADMLRCNLVVSFDFPQRFDDYMQAKQNCRNDSNRYVIMLNDFLGDDLEKRTLKYINLEKIVNNFNKRDCLETHEMELIKSLEIDYPPYPQTAKNAKSSPATIMRSVSIINRYCAKLPSDSFTKLSPEWLVEELDEPEKDSNRFICKVRLPINSPIRTTIIGPLAPTKAISIRLAAFTACKVLHRSGELDDNMLPIKKDSIRTLTPWLKEFPRQKATTNGKTNQSTKGQSVGSTKHRQYYKKRIAGVFFGPKVSADISCFMYKFKMVLTCPIPDEQNRRGRRIVDPGETNRNYAIICMNRLPKICSFPVFTRSGEVMISIECIEDSLILSSSQVSDLRTFHEYTFSKVLRLQKYPTIYDPENSAFTVLLAPVIDGTAINQLGGDVESAKIDWEFVKKIVKSDDDSFVPNIDDRKRFKFVHENYLDAVVIPWYRLTDRQQFAYYVAEIRTNMNPSSPFPDETSGFDTFVDYYNSKYDLTIYNDKQPVLDVDHTSARLNLLTPRYVNRKGKTLPSSTAKTRRESRESLDRKQLLIPELCAIHPFPASFWRKAVCLPAIFYRLNSLFLAEELRREVAAAIKVGFVEPPIDYNWPDLDFGWSLKDVIHAQPSSEIDVCGLLSDEDNEDNESIQFKLPLNDHRDTTLAIFDSQQKYPPSSESSSSKTGGDAFDFVIDHFDPSKLHIPDIPLDASPDEWSNIKLLSVDNIKLTDTNSSWSISDDDENEDEEGNNPFAHGYADWRDDKVKRQAFLREIFVPYFKSYVANYFKTSEELYEKLMNAGESSNGCCKSNNVNSKSLDLELNHALSSIEFTKNLEPILASKVIEQNLNCVLSNFFEDITFDGTKDVEGQFKEWQSLFSKMSALVERDMIENPSLFKDNDIELIPVDDSPIDFDLRVQPTFGQLLPNRDTPIGNGTETSDDAKLDVDSWKNIRFDPIRAEIESIGPGPSVILQALTMSNASDGINLERLETVGDSFLKYSITAYLYCMFPKLHEGKLSYLRSTEISNANLYQLGRAEDLGEIMSATKFEPNDNWLPPGYSVADTSSSDPSTPNHVETGPVVAASNECNENGSKIKLPKKGGHQKKREIDKALAEVPYDLLRQHSIPDKSIADCVEALIGAYLTASGSRAALLFMQWLGLRVIPPSYSLEQDLASHSKTTEDDRTIWRWLEIPPSPLIYLPPYYDANLPPELTLEKTVAELKEGALEELNRLYVENEMDTFETEIQYSFRDKAYLIQAFTHNSFHENHVTDCHQRLEFLGDALLDYLITRYLFEDPRCHSPGTLTDLRSALVNNTFFASLAVKYNFHKYLKYISEDLTHAIEDLVKKFRINSKNTITKGYTLLIGEGESEFAEDIEVPKALGDVFESVAGAIYLDSGMSLDQVWEVYFKMMKPEIEYFSQNVPKSPIRELLESKPQNVRFSPSELSPDKKHRVTVEVFGLGRFTGVGRSKHSAKSTAAKRALRMLEIRKNAESMEKQTKQPEPVASSDQSQWIQ